MSAPEADLDELLARLAQAQSAGAPEEELTAIRRQITLAGNREAAARQSVQRAESGRSKTPAPRLATAAPYTPHYAATPQIQFLLDQLRSTLSSSDLAPQLDFLLAHAEPFVALQITDDAFDETSLPLGASRFGHVPDLPPALPWPVQDGKKLPFLAQLDLSAFPHYPGALLPGDGWLYAFAALPDQIIPGNPWRYVILHHTGPREHLVRQSPDPGADDFWPSWGDHPYDLVTVLPRLAIDIDPQAVSHELDPSQLCTLREIIEPLLPFSNDSYADTGFAGHLLGQSGDCNDETATDSLNSLIQTNLHPIPTRLSQKPDGPGNDWIHLLSIRSVGSMEWCDAGFLYFVIRRSDLAARNFRDVVLSLCAS